MKADLTATARFSSLHLSSPLEHDAAGEAGSLNWSSTCATAHQGGSHGRSPPRLALGSSSIARQLLPHARRAHSRVSCSRRAGSQCAETIQISSGVNSVPVSESVCPPALRYLNCRHDIARRTLLSPYARHARRLVPSGLRSQVGALVPGRVPRMPGRVRWEILPESVRWEDRGGRRYDLRAGHGLSRQFHRPVRWNGLQRAPLAPAPQRSRLHPIPS